MSPDLTYIAIIIAGVFLFLIGVAGILAIHRRTLKEDARRKAAASWRRNTDRHGDINDTPL